ncbi:hypothetical protein ACHAXT_006572 [Thalassiosira profunda]
MSSHHGQGQHGEGANQPPPGSTLAALLSSQRRSAAQSDRYRVQRARPFADSSQVAQAVAPAQPSASQEPRPSSGHGVSSSSAPQRGPAAPSRVGLGEASDPTQRATFGPAVDPVTTAKSADEQRPRKRKSRWGAKVTTVSTNGAGAVANGASMQQTRGNSLVVQGGIATKGGTSVPDSMPVLNTEGRLPLVGDAKQPGGGGGNDQASAQNESEPTAIRKDDMPELDPISSPIRKRKLPPTTAEGREQTRPEVGIEEKTKKRRLSSDGPSNGTAQPPKPLSAAKQVRPKVGSEKTKKRSSSTDEPSATKANRMKEFSPFRVKVGCVVAVRFRKLVHGGNPSIVPVVKDGEGFRALDKGMNGQGGKKPAAKKGAVNRHAKQYEVWADPVPGEDDGLSLLGSWIRCAYPKSFVSKWAKKHSRNGTAPKRHVEGNVVSILGSDLDGQKGIAVGLLVDGSVLETLPYLQVLSDDSPDDTISSSEKVRRKLEAQIRGEEKVLVKVVLASSIDRRERVKADPGVVSQWFVRKRVSAKPAGKKPNKAERKEKKLKIGSLFIGDGTDSPSQQEDNWKWIVGRTSRRQESRADGAASGNINAGDSVPYLVGEMVKMDVTPKHEREASNTLATVTIKRLWAPEQTKHGRLAHHGTLELFDSIREGGSNELYFQAPVEDLIVIGKDVTRYFDGQEPLNLHSATGDDAGWSFVATHSYNASEGSYLPLCDDANEVSGKACHYCQRVCHNSTLQQCNHNDDASEAYWCVRCLQLIDGSAPNGDGEKWAGPCCTGKCDCLKCRSKSRLKGMMLDNSQSKIGQQFAGLAMALQYAPSVDFALSPDTGQLCLQPSFAPLSGDGRSKSYIKPKAKGGKESDKQKGKKKQASADTKAKKGKPASPKEVPDDYDVFKPVCHRAIPFDLLNQKRWGSSKQLYATDDTKQPSFRENAAPRVIKIGKAEEKTTLTGRAARASQRRMFKSLATLGDVSKKVDRLAGRDREQQLRFDKSRIHGWGVFNNGETINSGDLIIEYRGELIGNAVADKREVEYEKAGLDDYMFRIDAFTVCDATILGNVARYINASCTPNCYTQIITAGENKRIVIYAKRDIQRGEELAYDYKFSLEYDPSKRLPCHCGAPDCRGFMNWDKRYA